MHVPSGRRFTLVSVPVNFEIEGDSHPITDEQAGWLVAELRRISEGTISDSLAVAVLIEHELAESSGKPVHLTTEEGKALLGVLDRSPLAASGLRHALQRRRRLELGLE